MNRTLPPQAHSVFVPAQGYPSTPAASSEQAQQSLWVVGDPHSHNLAGGYNDNHLQTETPNQQQDLSTIRTPKRKRQSNSSENSNGDAPLSKRAMKRKHILEVHGTVGALDAPKGKTRIRNSRLEWHDGERQIWRPAAPHSDYRGEFILEDSMLGSYDICPDYGEEQGDITTFASAYGQQHWNVNDRLTWGNIQDSQGNEVLFLLEKPIRGTEPESSGYMMHNGLIMLDPDDNPVRDWPGVPRCFSSKVEGGRIESLRRICGMTIPDFRARMPRFIRMKGGNVKPLFGLTSINQRLSRFREKMDCPAWLTREKAGGFKKYTVQRLAAFGAPPVSTAGLPPLSEYEIERRKLEGRGKNPERAAGRSVSLEEREARGKQQMKRFQRLEAQEQARNQLPTVQLPVFDPTQSSYDYPEPISDLAGPLKRKRDDCTNDLADYQLLEPAQKRGHLASLQDTSPDVPGFNFLDDDADDVVSGAPLQVPDFDFGFGSDSNMGVGLNTGNIANPIASGPEDLRSVVPRNLIEQWSIKAALLPTAIDFQLYHGEGPPSIADDRSYTEQYQEIQSIHQSRWSHPDEAPHLVGLREWLGSFGQVPMPDLTEKAAGRLLGYPPENTAASNPQSTNMSVREHAQIEAGPRLKGRGAEYSGQQLMAPGTAIPRAADNGSQASADEEIVRYEDPKMVEQFSSLTEEEIINIIELDNFDMSAWDPIEDGVLAFESSSGCRIGR